MRNDILVRKIARIVTAIAKERDIPDDLALEAEFSLDEFCDLNCRHQEQLTRERLRLTKHR